MNTWNIKFISALSSLRILVSGKADWRQHFALYDAICELNRIFSLHTMRRSFRTWNVRTVLKMRFNSALIENDWILRTPSSCRWRRNVNWCWNEWDWMIRWFWMSASGLKYERINDYFLGWIIRFFSWGWFVNYVTRMFPFGYNFDF